MMADLTQVEKELVMVNMLSSNNSSRRKKAISKLRKWIRDTAELGTYVSVIFLNNTSHNHYVNCS